MNLNELSPDFSLKDQNGKAHSLSEYKGKWVLLYFYPRDFTPGCTTEACGIRDNFDEYKKKGIVVLGVSSDSVESHKKFAAKHELPFTLLSDENKKVIKMYGVEKEKNIFGKKVMGVSRTSYLINPKGEIAKIYKNVKPPIHASQVLEDVSKF